MGSEDPHATTRGRDREPAIRSHLWPRTRAGRIAVLVFLVLFVLAQPPVVHGPANRIEPWIVGLPFLYAYLLGIYALLVAVLIWARGRDL